VPQIAVQLRKKPFRFISTSRKRSESNPIHLATFFRSKIEQHNNEQEQHHHGAGVNEHLNDPDKECIERYEQGGKPKETNYQAKRTRDRVTVNNNSRAEGEHHDGEEPEEKDRHDKGFRFQVSGKRRPPDF